MNAGFVNHRGHLAEQHIDMTPPFIDDGVKAQGADQAQEQGHAYGRAKKGGDNRQKKGAHRLTSRMACCAWLKSVSRTLCTYASNTSGPFFFNSVNCAAMARNGSTS